jgi:hypothetical protein
MPGISVVCESMQPKRLDFDSPYPDRGIVPLVSKLRIANSRRKRSRKSQEERRKN